jgi:hypothetical protein
VFKKKPPTELTKTGALFPPLPETVWSVLADETSWAEWWPMDLERPPAVHTERPMAIRLAPDSAGSERGLRMDLGTEWAPGCIPVTVTIWRNGPPLKRGESEEEGKRLQKTLWALQETVARRVVALGYPDTDALKASGDIEGLTEALHHSNAWVRVRAAAALEGLVPWQKEGGPPQETDPRVWEALLAAANDQSDLIRGRVQLGLVRVPDPRALEALIRFQDDPSPSIQRDAKDRVRQWEYQMELREKWRLGETFGGEPGELFLGSPLAVLMTDREALGTSVEATALAPWTIEVRVEFPSVCSGCMEPTERRGSYRSEPAWEYSDRSTRPMVVRRTVIAGPVRWPVPICERCDAYGLLRLTRIGGHYAIGAKEGSFWVAFRFANVAYLDPFAAANGVTGRSRIILTGQGLGFRADQKPRDIEELEAALADWTFVRDGIGFHRYLEVRKRLRQLSESRPPDLAQQIRALAAEFSLTVEQLHDVERVARQRFGVVEVLGRP